MKLIFLIIGSVFGFAVGRAIQTRGVAGLRAAAAGALGLSPDDFDEVYPPGSFVPGYDDFEEFDPAGE